MLIQGILVIKEQINFIQNEDLGYSNSEKIVLPITTETGSDNAQSLKRELEGLAGIDKVGLTSTHPGLLNIEGGSVAPHWVTSLAYHQ